VIIAPAASSELAFLKTSIPVIYVTDGTFASCLNYHKSLTNLLAGSVKEGNAIEQRAIDACKFIIVSSEWAGRSVIKDYKAGKEKVITVPYGANFEKLPLSEEMDYTPPGEWKLLFVGVYWESKGGKIAFDAFKLLADKGYPVSLTVLGCIPPSDVTHPKLKVIPFIDKNDDTGQKHLFEIFKQHHFLILPTRFDCTPIVINEASAFGIPSLVANSGGVAGHLREGKNGYLVDYNDMGEGYATKIEAFIISPEKYTELRKQTRLLFENELNWNHWAEELKKLL
jgi:glycosyltransferase involved in cell wall biosynthesis